MAAGDNPVRRTAYYEGRVQGVGFRYTTNSIAQDFRVVGQVRNLDDGRVELIAEGQAAELARFLNQVGETLGRYIHGSKITESPATGQFATFSIASH
jgi:acylphosphatase